MSRLPKLLALVAISILGAIAVDTSNVVDAGGPSSTCSSNYLCISRYTITSSGTTTMTNGWRLYAPSTNQNNDSPGNCGANPCGPNSLSNNDTFSGSGSTVGYDYDSIRNRDNINGRLMCVGSVLGGGAVGLQQTANYYTQSWVQMSSTHTANGLWQGGTSNSCSGGS